MAITDIDGYKKSMELTTSQDRYFAEVFTQLVLNGLSVEAAKQRAEEALSVILKRDHSYFPNITVG